MKTFRNPVSPFDAPDPFMTYVPETGYYYALFTRGRVLELFRSRHAAEICTAGDSRVIYRANGPEDGIWGDIWAPEMHRGSNGKWYIYTSGRMQEAPGEKRLFIMEALWDRQRFEPAAFCLTMTSLYFTALANGNSKMYHSDDFIRLIDEAGLGVEEIHDNLGQGHSIIVCKLK